MLKEKSPLQHSKMFTVAVLLSLAASCLADADILHPHSVGKIVGGKDANISNYPYQLFLTCEDCPLFWTANCGAVIISDSWALTAAHCLFNASYYSTITLRAGSSNRDRGGYLHTHQTFGIHPLFDNNTFDYDIGFIQVSSPFVFGDNVAPIALPSQGETVDEGTSAVVTGWGQFEDANSTLPTVLQELSVSLLSSDVCSYYNTYRPTDRMICTAHPSPTSGFCHGDSGGPLVANGKLVGIVSFFLNHCAWPNYPDYYTNVASMRTWIYNNTGV